MNPAAANRTPFTRPITSAWLETSMTTARTPESTIEASNACRSVASGVVRTLGSSVVTGAPSAARPRVRVCTVPISPLGHPAAARPASTR